MRTNNRWVIAIAGVFLQIALGAVYAWSVFRIPLAKQFDWSISEVTLTFTISIFVLGFAAFFGGLWLNRKGPRVVALTGGALYGLGVFLASFSHNLWWLYLSYGLIGGIGLGFGYIVPVAVLVKWFPDRRGLITGIAVGGFGAGALITAPLATRLIQAVGVLNTFAYLGIAFLIVTVVSGFFMQNPSEGWKPDGWTPSATQTSQRAGHDFTLGEALKTWQWWALWLLLFLNTCAGISIISQEAPIFEELTGVSALVAGSMVGLASIGNAAGRVFWAWISDSITRRATFFTMFLVPSCTSLVSSERRHGLFDDDHRVRRADVLRRRIWHDAGLCRGLFWSEECRSHLRPDVDSLGLRQRVRAAADRVYARSKRLLSRSAAPHRRTDGGFNATSNRDFATKN
jgi:OFA family oxalate/formate antiporter-like MFS transporter